MGSNPIIPVWFVQVAKWKGIGLQNQLFVGSNPTLDSNHRSVA
jgi:hypothetical protein